MAQMKYFYELTISSSPHVHSATTTKTIMRDVLIALAPAMIMSIVFFGFRALTVTAVSVLACYLTFVGAFASISPLTLLVYLLLWLLPSWFLTGWVDQF